MAAVSAAERVMDVFVIKGFCACMRGQFTKSCTAIQGYVRLVLLLLLLAPLHHFLLRRSSTVVEGWCEGHSDRLLLVTPLSTQSSLTPPCSGSRCAINSRQWRQQLNVTQNKCKLSETPVVVVMVVVVVILTQLEMTTCLSMSHSGCTLFGWQNTWESDSRRPRHPRALDNQQLLANEGSKKKGTHVRVDGVRKRQHFVKRASLT